MGNPVAWLVIQVAITGENVAKVEVLPVPNPILNERRTAMRKMMVAVSKEKSNMTESDGRGRKNTENRSERRPILWYNTQYSDR